MTDKARPTVPLEKVNLWTLARLLEDLIPEFKASRDGDYSFGPIVKLNSTCSK